MKKSTLTLIMAMTALSIGTFLYFKYDKEQKEKNFYVLYYPGKDLEFNWSKFKHLFPKDFKPTKTIVEIGEILKLNEQEREIYDSIKNNYYSHLNLRKEHKGNGFYLSLNPSVSIFYQKTNSPRKINEDKVAGYDLISLDSLVKITPGLEYYQIKNKNRPQNKANHSFHIIEKIPESKKVRIHKVRPIVEEYE